MKSKSHICNRCNNTLGAYQCFAYSQFHFLTRHLEGLLENKHSLELPSYPEIDEENLELYPHPRSFQLRKFQFKEVTNDLLNNTRTRRYVIDDLFFNKIYLCLKLHNYQITKKISIGSK